MIQRFNLEQDFTIRWLIETYQDLNLLVNCLESLEVRRPGQLQNLPNSVWPRKDGVFTLPLSARLLLSNEKQGNHKHSLSAANCSQSDTGYTGLYDNTQAGFQN